MASEQEQAESKKAGQDQPLDLQRPGELCMATVLHNSTCQQSPPVQANENKRNRALVQWRGSQRRTQEKYRNEEEGQRYRLSFHNATGYRNNNILNPIEWRYC